MSDQIPCPRGCGGRTWVMKEITGDWVLKCMCGYLGWIEKYQDGMRLKRTVIRAEEVGLPQADTKISRCLYAMVLTHPEPSKTAEVAERAGLKRGETSSLLVALMGQGLIDRVEVRKGLEGGSIWELTYTAEKLLNL